MDDALSFLKPIMTRCGAQGSAAQFHAAVNVAFHEQESEVYDHLHQDMWTSLPPLFTLFAGDCLRAGDLPAKLDMLDIGCGTGLASDSVMKSPLGPRIRSIDLLDTSPKMLSRAVARSKSWGVPARPFEGLLDSLPFAGRYHFIVTCSVLHHVPDLASFLSDVAKLQASSGCFLHLQDPNGDADGDPELQRRMAMLPAKRPEWLARLSPRRIASRLWREITGRQGDDYIAATNRQLRDAGVIQLPLTALELFSITDIHVHDSLGVSVPKIGSWLPDYQMVSQRAYGFFGALRSSLPARLQPEEDRLLAEGALNGIHIGATWKRTGHPGEPV